MPLSTKREPGDNVLRARYGISLERYHKLLKKQKGGCALCGHKPKPNKRLAVDHTHGENKRIRGLLCTQCNWCVIGFLEANKISMRKLSAYLRRKGIKPKPNPIFQDYKIIGWREPTFRKMRNGTAS